jgi:HEAT repeat protein
MPPRVLGATEDKAAFDVLLDRALHDSDLRVRASAIRALGQLNDARATTPLLTRAQLLTSAAKSDERNEVIELATTLGRVNQKSATPQVELLKWLSATSEAMGHTAVELEIASARVSPERYVAFAGTDNYAVRMMLTNWRAGSRIAQGLGEIATLEKGDNNQTAARAVEILRAMLDYKNSGIRINTLVAVHSEYAVPDVLQAIAAFKPKELSEIARPHLTDPDVIVRATAAELLGGQPSDVNTRALADALPRAMRDADNDAALAILSALAKQKNDAANKAVKTALDSKDHLIRRRAVALLKANGVGDFSSSIGTVQTRNTDADYQRAIARIGKKPTATVTTTKGLIHNRISAGRCAAERGQLHPTGEEGLLQWSDDSARSAEFCGAGRRPARRSKWRAWLHDSLRDQRSPLRTRSRRHGAVGQGHGWLAMVCHPFAATAPRRWLHRFRTRHSRHGSGRSDSARRSHREGCR